MTCSAGRGIGEEQMNKGIIYAMSTVVPGLVKIGKTATGNFEQRMYQLEHNGYYNVVGLRREFAIEVDNYDDKESLLDDIFSRSRVGSSELFALDIDLVIQLLSSFEGRQVFPKEEIETKEEAFTKATIERKEHIASSLVPDGEYYLERKLKKDGNRPCKAKMVVSEGCFVVPKGERVSATEGAGLSCGIAQSRKAKTDESGLVLEDASFDSPSGAGCFVIGASCDGWVSWKNKEGDYIDIYRR